MTKHNQNGSAVTILVISLLSVFLVATIGFAAWAYSGRQTYKNDVDQKVADAVAVAKKEQQDKDTIAAAEAAKQPLTTYKGPDTYGSIVMMYPKTWSGYVSASGNSSGTPIDGYFAPGVVPSISSQSSVFATRVQVSTTPYAQLVQQATQSQNAPKASAYSLPKVPSVVGVKLVGTLPGKDITGEMIILPLRDKSLVIWTVGDQYKADFENIILNNFSFSP